MSNQVVLNKYELLEEIGRGAFSKIYRVRDVYTSAMYALKMDTVPKNEDPLIRRLIIREANIHKELRHIRGIPKMLWFGCEDFQYYMVLPLLCSSLKFMEIPKTNALELLRMGQDMLDILRDLHEFGYIHRDIKPDNWMYDAGGSLYLIDLGLCKRYLKGDGTHFPQKQISGMIGTTNYVSLNVHNRIEPSRRDDVESVLYVLLKICRVVDWDSDVNASYETIYSRKLEIGNGPLRETEVEWILRFLWDTRLLTYDETPCYNLSKYLVLTNI